MYDNKKFILDIKKFIKDTEATITLVRKKVALDIFARVINRTPVDKGLARGNWQCTLGAPTTRELKQMDTAAGKTPAPFSGGPTIDKMTRKVEKLSMRYPSIFLSNNIPYITILENGKYRYKNTEKVTAEGYSRQAPQGMVKITLEEFPYLFEISVAEAKKGE